MITSLIFNIEERVYVKLTKTKLYSTQYLAMAFSDDPNMGRDLVFAFSPKWNTMIGTTPRIGIHVFWTLYASYRVERELKLRHVLQDISHESNDSFHTVAFSLDKQIKIRDKTFNLEKGHHILLSTGQTLGNTLTYHTFEGRLASKSKITPKGN